MARAQIQMISICENDFCAEFFERFLGESLDGGLSADGHEEGSLDSTVGRGEPTTACAGGIDLRYFKGKLHSGSVSGENPCNGGTQQGEKQVDAYNYAGRF